MSWSAEKLVVVGIDGGSWNVLEPWCMNGVMPTLAGLRKQGSFGVLNSVIPPITPSAWTSLLTGQTPGRHRVLDFVRYDPATRSLALVNSSDLPAGHLFNLLRDARKDVIAVNLPMTYPPPELRGALVSGFGTPSADSSFTYPPELREEVLDLAPGYRFGVDWQAKDAGDLAGLATDVESIAAAFTQRVQVARHLSADRPWNLLLVHLKFYDDFLHKAFGYTEPGAAPRGRTLLRRCLSGLDSALADIAELAASAGAPMLVVSDHGFGSLRGRLYPNALLHRWGYLALRGPLGRLAHKAHKQFAPKGAGMAAQDLAARIPLDWPRTRAYVMYTGPCPFVYVNRRGREPHGVVGPEEVEALVAELAGRFRDYRHPAAQGPVFEQAIPGTEFFAGQDTSTPDLVLVPQEGLVPRRRLSRPGSEVEPVDTLEGYHRQAGLWLAAGANVRQGMTEEAGLADILPTVLAALGVPLPPDLDGRPMDIFTDPPEISHSTASAAGTGPRRDVYSSDEEARVRRRLRDLGYL